jgi:hypothetical protein
MWTEMALDILQPVALALLSLLAAKATQWIREHTAHVQTREALVRLTQAVAGAVAEVEQGYVRELKQAAADGRITSAEEGEARARAIAAAYRLLGDEGARRVRQALGTDLQQAIVAEIERRISEAK